MKRPGVSRMCGSLVLAATLLISVKVAMGQFNQYHDLVAPLPATLEAFSDRTPVIVEAEVQSLFEPTVVGRGGFRPDTVTDAVLRVDRVLKGPERLSEIVVAQDKPFLKIGERSIFFLLEFNSPERIKMLATRPGLVRYELSASGVFRIEGGKVAISPDVPFHQKYQGGPVEKVLADIGSHVRVRALPKN